MTSPIKDDRVQIHLYGEAWIRWMRRLLALIGLLGLLLVGWGLSYQDRSHPLKPGVRDKPGITELSDYDGPLLPEYMLRFQAMDARLEKEAEAKEEAEENRRRLIDELVDALEERWPDKEPNP